MTDKSVSRKRLWISVGLAVAIWACALIVCGLGAQYLWQTFIGDPPGQGARAQLGYQACAPIIAALESYHQAHAAYPASLQHLVPPTYPRFPASSTATQLATAPPRAAIHLSLNTKGQG